MPPIDAQQRPTGSTGMTRRRAMTVIAGAAGLSLGGLFAAGRGASAGDPKDLHRWQGVALGARATLVIHHQNPREARRLTGLARAEIERLEKIFSLYRRDSALSALNRNGRLDDPPLDLVILLNRARAWGRVSDGAFDVTLQPLWSLYQRHFADPDADARGPTDRELAAARRLVDYRLLEIEPRQIRLGRAGMAITLNGIAQGYITDRVAALLRAEGLAQVMVDLGEIQTIGNHPSGRPWRIGLEGLETQAVTDRAVATSAVNGTLFDTSGSFHHLLDPRTGRPTRGRHSATVIAHSACDADALSTALLVSTPAAATLRQLAQQGIEKIVTLDARGMPQRLL